MTVDYSELITVLTNALTEAVRRDDANADLARHIAAALIEAGADIAIESDDPVEDDCSEDDLPRSRRVATTQVHRLMVEGVEVAALEREGWSYYGDIGHPNTTSGEWTTDRGEGDHQPTRAWVAIADEADLSGDWEDYPEAEEEDAAAPETDDEGEYCLWWHSPSDDRPLTGKRYEAENDAEAARQLAQHDLHSRHRGTLLCSYGIARLIDGEWTVL